MPNTAMQVCITRDLNLRQVWRKEAQQSVTAPITKAHTTDSGDSIPHNWSGNPVQRIRVVDCPDAVHRLVKAMKGRSSYVLRSEFPHLRSRFPTLWTNAYFVATTGGAPLAAIKRYAENQKYV